LTDESVEHNSGNVEKVETTKHSPIDRAPLLALQELQVEGEQNIVDQIISTYLFESDILINQLEDAFERNDVLTIQKTAHSLKSSSAQVGALDLSEMCKKLEMACKNNTLENGSDTASRIPQEYVHVKKALKQEISKT
jgi:HPt (histidine-containing phosphotransfer) domain-containing protein